MHSLIARIFNKTGFIKTFRLTVPVRINGKRIVIPVINGMGYNNIYSSEQWMCDLLKKILPLKQGAFIDVGVNIGQTLIKFRSVDNERRYIGFEPNPNCVYYTDTLIRENGFANCSLIPAGLFDRDTVLELNLYSAGSIDSAASLMDDFRIDKVYRKIFVPVYNFDQLSGQLKIPPAAIVKIDVEGAELEVLKSFNTIMRSQRPFILVEILPCYNADNTERINRQQQIESFVKGLGYRIMRIIKSEDGLSVKQLMPLDSIGIHANKEWCEYLFLPEETTVTGIGS